MNKKAVAMEIVKRVCHGFECEHDKATCPKCIAGKPCLHGKKEYHYLGNMDINPGECFLVETENPHHVRLSYIGDKGILADVKRPDFEKAFKTVG